MADRITRLFNFAGNPPGDSLISAWNLEDVSDSFGSNTLTNNNAATFVSGKISNAVNLNGTTQYLSKSSVASLSVDSNGTFSICGWFKLNALPGVGQVAPVISKWDASSNKREYRILVNEFGDFRFEVSADGTAIITANSGNSVITTNVWYFFVVWYDRQKLYLEINNSGVFYSTSFSQDVFVSDPELRIGTLVSGAAGLFAGLIDALRFYKRVISASERSVLYNKGVGRQYVASTIISEDEVNREVDQIINLLSGITTDIPVIIGEYVVGYSGSQLEVNQDGIGPILQCLQSDVLKLEVKNNGQIKSYVPQGTAPINISTTGLCENLNVDLLDGLNANQLLQINSYFPNIDSVLFSGTPAIGDRKLINPQSNNLLYLLAQQQGAASTDAQTIVSIKKDNSTEDVLGSVTLTGNTQAVITSEITDATLNVANVIFEITSITGVMKHSNITVGVVSKQLPL